MSAERINFNPNCFKCGKKLQLDEMHYYEDPDNPGNATCDECERAWMESVDAWHRGKLVDFPTR